MITEILYNPYDKDLQDAYQIELEKIRMVRGSHLVLLNLLAVTSGFEPVRFSE